MGYTYMEITSPITIPWYHSILTEIILILGLIFVLTRDLNKYIYIYWYFYYYLNTYAIRCNNIINKEIYVKKAQRHAKARYFKSPPRKVVIEIL